MVDKIKGGLADNKKPSDFDQKQLAMGIKVEMEHTNDKSKAREIAMDHLTEDPKYYTKLKEVEKYDRVDVEADGKKELDYGSEELDKIKKRWKKLKKALNNAESIMDISSQEYQDDDQGEDDPSTEDQMREQMQDEDETAGADGEQDVEPQAEEQPAEDQQMEQADPEAEVQEAEEAGASDEEIEQMLRDEGYSDSEIAYIMHNHVAPQTTVDDIKVDSEQAMSEHKIDHQKRMDDLDYDIASFEHETNSLDRDHKQRMLDLEYDQARRLKEMELKYKEEEYKTKLQNMKNKQQKPKVRDQGRSSSMDAAKTSKEEMEGK